MKKSSLFILFFLCATRLSLFAQDTTYQNSLGQPTTPDKAFTTYSIKTKTAEGWQVGVFFKSGKPEMTGLFLDDSLTQLQGETTWYNEKGNIVRRSTYEKGKQEGPSVYFHDNGHKKITGSYKNDVFEGEWLSFYPSGKPSGKAVFANGKQVSATFYEEDGSVNKSVKEFFKDASYPGGPSQFQRYITKNISYPETALKNGIEGTVIVLFKITKNGTVADVKIARSVDKSLDGEAIRLVRGTSDWEPAMFGGIASDSYARQPIVFTLNEKDRKKK